jgi:hypothetical protein
MESFLRAFSELLTAAEKLSHDRRRESSEKRSHPVRRHSPLEKALLPCEREALLPPSAGERSVYGARVRVETCTTLQASACGSLVGARGVGGGAFPCSDTFPSGEPYRVAHAEAASLSDARKHDMLCHAKCIGLRRPGVRRACGSFSTTTVQMCSKGRKLKKWVKNSISSGRKSFQTFP